MAFQPGSTRLARFTRMAAGAGLLIGGIASAAPGATVSGVGAAEHLGDALTPYETSGSIFFGTSAANTTSGSATAVQPSYTNATSDPHAFISLPAYVSGVSFSGAKIDYEAYGYSYSNIKPTGSSSDIEAGLAYNNGTGATTSGTEYQLATITFGAAANVRIGVLLNVESANDQNPTSLRLASGSNSAMLTVDHTYNTSHPQGGNDLYLFDVNAGTNDSVTLYGTADSNGFNHVVFAGLTFAPVPEPASGALAAVGCVGLLARRRRG